VIFSTHRRRTAAVLAFLTFASVAFLGQVEAQPINPFCSAVKTIQSLEVLYIQASKAVSVGAPFPQFRKKLISAADATLKTNPRLIDGLTTFSTKQKSVLKAGTSKSYGRLKAALLAAADDAKALLAYRKWLEQTRETSRLQDDANDALEGEALKRCGIKLYDDLDPSAQNTPLQTEPLALTSREVLEQINRQGSKGYAFVGAFFFGTTGVPAGLFVQSVPGAKYEYVAERSILKQQTRGGLLATLQRRGGQGFVLRGPLANPLEPESVSLVFLKNSAAQKTTFDYRLEPRPADETGSLALMNANGADGYVYIGDYVPDLSNPELIVAMSVKDNSSQAKYSYETGPVLDTIDQIFTELNARGGAGAGWKGSYLAGTEVKMLYERSSEPKGPISYAFGPASASIEELVKAAIDQFTAKGLAFSGQYNAGGQSYNVYTNSGVRSLPFG
jgi:hypothetical protein